MPITLQESLRGLLYAPYYAALALGAYRSEGVEVDLVSAPTPGQAPAGLFAGTVDVAWGGPMRIMQMYESRADCDLVCFGEVVTRDPFLLVEESRIPISLSPTSMANAWRPSARCRHRGFACRRTFAGSVSIPTACRGPPIGRWPTMRRPCGAASSMSCNCSSPLPRS